MILRIGVSAMLGVLVSGCSFTAPQFEAGIRRMERAFFGRVATSEQSSATWLASVGEHGAVVNPYVSNNLIVFANTDGDAIAFDGWTVRSVVGFGFEEPLSISGKSGSRYFTFGGEQTLANCDQWVLTGLSWRQVCSNGPGEILIDDAGHIQRITMAIGDGSDMVTLQVVK